MEPTPERQAGLRGVGPPLAVALVCAFALQCATGLVSPDGGGYSPHVALRLQTEALLQGRIALQPHPFGARHDWMWARDGMHQPWGLGVPALRLPGEVVAKLVGVVGFPDRLTFLAIYALAVGTLFAGLRRALALPRAVGDPPLGAWGTAALGTFFLALFPSFVNLVGSRFSVYEEVESYGCVWALLQLGLLLGFRARPTPRRLLVLAASCAVACWIRPTGLFFGAITLALALWVALRVVPRERPSLPWLVAACAVAALGPGVLLAVNLARFGDPFEFGMRLFLSFPQINALLRLGDVLTASPGARELLLVAFAPEHATHEPAGGLWTGDATWRYVEIYFAVFRPAMAVALAASGIGWLVALGRRRQLAGRPGVGAAATLGAWGGLTLAALVGFYLTTPALTSRYLAELAPSLAACLLSGVLVAQRCLRSPAASRALGAAAVAVAALWLAQRQTEFVYPFEQGVSADRVAHELVRNGPRMPVEIPSTIRCGGVPPDRFRIARNGQGWAPAPRCRFRSGTQIVLPASACIELELAAEGGALPSPEALAGIRATSDLRELRRVAVRRAGSRALVRLCEDEPAPWRLAGLQLVTLGRADAPVLSLRSIRAVDPEPAAHP